MLNLRKECEIVKSIINPSQEKGSEQYNTISGVGDGVWSRVLLVDIIEKLKL